MPPAPEFGGAFRYVRIVEVFLIGKAKDPAHADRHVGVAGKVKIELERIEHGDIPRAEHGHPTRSCGRGQLLDDEPADVCQQHFL